MPDLWYCADHDPYFRPHGHPDADCVHRDGSDNALGVSQAALTEYAIDTYASGFTFYWSRKATTYLDANSDFLSNSATVVGLIAIVVGTAENPIIGILAALLALNLAHQVNMLNNASRSAAAANACLIFSMRWWELAIAPIDTVINHWGSTAITTDALECRDHYYNHVA